MTFFVDSIPAAHAGARSRSLPVGLGDLHRLHVRGIAPDHRGGRPRVFPAHDHVHPAGRRNSGDHTNVIKWGGYIGLATAAAAWYALFAAVVNSTFGRTIAPVMPLRWRGERRLTRPDARRFRTGWRRRRLHGAARPPNFKRLNAAEKNRKDLSHDTEKRRELGLHFSGSSEAQIAVHWREEEYVKPPASFVEQANAADPAILDRFSEEHFPECFEEYADLLTWDAKSDTILDTSEPPFWKWWVGGSLNACVNCVDRHLETSADKPAFIWVPEPEDAEIRKSPTSSSMTGSTSSPPCSKISPASRPAIASPSTCRCFLSSRSRCSPALASA